MNDETKEILDRFDKKLKNYELDKKFGQLSIDSICHLFPSEIITIKDYITSLQEYKSRCEEAIEFIKNFKYGMPYTEWVKKEELLNILNGGDE